MSEPPSIFISYAHHDNQDQDPERRWLDRLLQFLRPLALEKKIKPWSDQELTAGANWRAGIRDAVENAKVAILLVSPAFLASEFIRTEELPRLLRAAAPKTNLPDSDAESALIIPILIRPCLIHHVSFGYVEPGMSEELRAKLSDFQYVPPIGAMNGLTQEKQDLALLGVAERIIDALSDDDDIEQGGGNTPPSQRDPGELDLLVRQFLDQYARWYFNAQRIKNWGSKQKGYRRLGSHSVRQLTASLDRLVATGDLVAKPGKRSKSVYKTSH